MWQVLFERLAVAGERRVFAPLAFVQHGLVRVTRERAAHGNPAAVHRAHGGATFVSVTAKLPDFVHQLHAGRAALIRVAHEEGLQVSSLCVLGTFAKTVLAVAAALQQVIQGVDHLIVVDLAGIRHVGTAGLHRRLLKRVGLLVNAVPGGAAGLAGLRPAQAGAVFFAFPVTCQTVFCFIKAALIAGATLQPQPIGRGIVVVGAPGFVIGLAVVIFFPIGFFCGRVDCLSNRFAAEAADDGPDHRTGQGADGSGNHARCRAGSRAAGYGAQARTHRMRTRRFGDGV